MTAEKWAVVREAAAMVEVRVAVVTKKGRWRASEAVVMVAAAIVELVMVVEGKAVVAKAAARWRQTLTAVVRALVTMAGSE